MQRKHFTHNPLPLTPQSTAAWGQEWSLWRDSCQREAESRRTPPLVTSAALADQDPQTLYQYWIQIDDGAALSPRPYASRSVVQTAMPVFPGSYHQSTSSSTGLELLPLCTPQALSPRSKSQHWPAITEARLLLPCTPLTGPTFLLLPGFFTAALPHPQSSLSWLDPLL